MAEVINDKYIVIKTEDAEKYLDDFERGQLEMICRRIAKRREADGKAVNAYWVCNQDEPYADKVLQVILDGEDQKKNEYKKVYCLGNDIDSVVKSLLAARDKGELISTDFNGHMLYSDTVTLDGAYLEITGKTKAEFDKAQQEWREEYERKEQEHKAKIPDLTEEWKQKGREILAEAYWELWDKCVPIRLGDLYHGMELGCCLNIVKILNGGGTLEEAKKEIEKQGHSGVSWGLVCSMVKAFCDRGQEFVNFVK